MKADDVGRRLLYAALLTASALLMLLMVTLSTQSITPIGYSSAAPAVQVTPLPAMSEHWLPNCGDARSLDEMPGIGTVIAQRIIENREADGAFFFPEDLMEVKGIGEKTLNAIMEWLDAHPEKAYIWP